MGAWDGAQRACNDAEKESPGWRGNQHGIYLDKEFCEKGLEHLRANRAPMDDGCHREHGSTAHRGHGSTEGGMVAQHTGGMVAQRGASHSTQWAAHHEAMLAKTTYWISRWPCSRRIMGRTTLAHSSCTHPACHSQQISHSQTSHRREATRGIEDRIIIMDWIVVEATQGSPVVEATQGSPGVHM